MESGRKPLVNGRHATDSLEPGLPLNSPLRAIRGINNVVRTRNVARAAVLAETVVYTGRGRFTVAGRSGPYTVQAPYRERSVAAWSCNCEWGQHAGRLCAHVRAADLYLTRRHAGQVAAAA